MPFESIALNKTIMSIDNSGRTKICHLITLENSFRYIYCHPSDGSGVELDNVFHLLIKSSFDVRLTVAEIRIQILMQIRMNTS